MQQFCNYCGQPIWGSSVNALGANWHPEHFLCASCGQPFTTGTFQVFAGKPYHDHCFRQNVAPRCTYCGQPLTENYIQVEGKPYHDHCFRQNVAPRCTYCQKPLIGKYLTDSWGDSFCLAHEQEYPHCSFCSRLIPPRQQTRGWNDYECLRCEVCRASAIETSEEAQPLFTRCKQWMSQQGFRFNQLPIQLKLRTRSDLLDLLKEHPVNHPLGVTLTSSRTQNGYQLDNRIDGVAVQQGMPAILFEGTVLHELGHVWLAVHGIRVQQPWAEEGFAQLLSYRYYKEEGSKQARYHATNIEKDNDPVYGDGFRRIQAQSEQIGFVRFIEAILAGKRLPIQ